VGARDRAADACWPRALPRKRVASRRPCTGPVVPVCSGGFTCCPDGCGATGHLTRGDGRAHEAWYGQGDGAGGVVGSAVHKGPGGDARERRRGGVRHGKPLCWNAFRPFLCVPHRFVWLSRILNTESRGAWGHACQRTRRCPALLVLVSSPDVRGMRTTKCR
jgi:hypothetical protein